MFTTKEPHHDIVNRPLKEGNIVVHIGGGRYSSPKMYEVVGFTPQMVKLTRVKKETFERTGAPYNYNADKCVIVGHEGRLFT